MKVIVSVTTTKARLGMFFYSLQSLESQKFDNFQIMINLSRDPYLFDEGVEISPGWMDGKKCDVNFVKNVGPYRKLIPLIERVGDADLIVTADDDVLYDPNWLKSIVEAASKYPSSIICGGARKITKNILGRFQNYKNWHLCTEPKAGMELLPIGAYGVAYRRTLLDLEFLVDPAHIKYAPTADDIWFRLASIRQNTPVYVDPSIGDRNAYIQHGQGLDEVNLHRLDKQHGLIRKVTGMLKNEACNYIGIRLSKNDFAWKFSFEFSRNRIVNQ